MKKLIIILLLCLGINSFSQTLNIKGFGDWENIMIDLSTTTTTNPCLDNTFLANKEIKSVKQIFSEPDSINSYSYISISLTEYDTTGIIKSIKHDPYDEGYCYEHTYSYDSIYCTYEIDYKSNCGMIEPNGEMGNIRGFKLLEKHNFYNSNNGLKVEETYTYNSNLVVYKYKYNSKGLVISITKYLNQREQNRTLFEYEYYK